MTRIKIANVNVKVTDAQLNNTSFNLENLPSIFSNFDADGNSKLDQNEMNGFLDILKQAAQSDDNKDELSFAELDAATKQINAKIHSANPKAKDVTTRDVYLMFNRVTGAVRENMPDAQKVDYSKLKLQATEESKNGQRRETYVDESGATVCWKQYSKANILEIEGSNVDKNGFVQKKVEFAKDGKTPIQEWTEFDEKSGYQKVVEFAKDGKTPVAEFSGNDGKCWGKKVVYAKDGKTPVAEFSGGNEKHWGKKVVFGPDGKQTEYTLSSIRAQLKAIQKKINANYEKQKNGSFKLKGDWSPELQNLVQKRAKLRKLLGEF